MSERAAAALSSSSSFSFLSLYKQFIRLGRHTALALRASTHSVAVGAKYCQSPSFIPTLQVLEEVDVDQVHVGRHGRCDDLDAGGVVAVERGVRRTSSGGGSEQLREEAEAEAFLSRGEDARSLSLFSFKKTPFSFSSSSSPAAAFPQRRVDCGDLEKAPLSLSLSLSLAQQCRCRCPDSCGHRRRRQQRRRQFRPPPCVAGLAWSAAAFTEQAAASPNQAAGADVTRARTPHRLSLCVSVCRLPPRGGRRRKSLFARLSSLESRFLSLSLSGIQGRTDEGSNEHPHCIRRGHRRRALH